MLIGPIGSVVTLRMRRAGTVITHAADDAGDGVAASVDGEGIQARDADVFVERRIIINDIRSNNPKSHDDASVSSGSSIASMRSDVIDDEPAVSSSPDALPSSFATCSIGMQLVRNRFGQHFVHKLCGNCGMQLLMRSLLFVTQCQARHICAVCSIVATKCVSPFARTHACLLVRIDVVPTPAHICFRLHVQQVLALDGSSADAMSANSIRTKMRGAAGKLIFGCVTRVTFCLTHFIRQRFERYHQTIQ